MSNESKPKIFELARKYGFKPVEFLKLVQDAGYNYNGFNATFNEDEEEMISKIQPAAAPETKDVHLIGVYYNPENRKYHTADIKLSRAQFETLGGNLGKPEGTIFNLIPAYELLESKLKIRKPRK